MVKLGIIGAGGIAAVMSKTVRRMNETGNKKIQLYGIASRTMEKAEQFAEKNGVLRAYGSYDGLIFDPEIDLVYVAVPHSHHYEITKRCLKQGKAVLVEKAFTVNAAEARELISLAGQKRLFLAEAIWTRYQPMRRIIQETIASGIVGEPKMLAANLGKPISEVERIRSPKLAGGVLLDLGVYALNFAEMVFGRPESVSAACSKNDLGVDMNDTYTLTFADGKIAVLYASVEALLDGDGVIYGTKGYIRVRNINNPEAVFVYDRDRELIKNIEAPKKLTGYEYEVEEAVDALESGLTECASMPLAETLHIMELMDEIRGQLGIRYPSESGYQGN